MPSTMPEDVEEKPKTYRSEGDGDENKGTVRQRCDIVTEEKGDLSRMAEDEIPKAASENELKSTNAAAARSKPSTTAVPTSAAAAAAAAGVTTSASSITTPVTANVVNGTTTPAAGGGGGGGRTPNNDNFTAFKKFNIHHQQNGGAVKSSTCTPGSNLSSPLPPTLNSALYLPYSYAAAAAAAAATMPPLMLQGGRLPFVATPYASPSSFFGAQSPLFSGEGAMPASMSYPFLNLIDFSKTGSRGGMVIPAQASPSYGSPYLSAMEFGLLAARNSPMFGSVPSSPSYGLSPLNSPTTNTAIPVIGKPQFFPLLSTGAQSQAAANHHLQAFLRFPGAAGGGGGGSNPLASMAQVSLPAVTSTVTSVATNFLTRQSSSSNSDDEKQEMYVKQRLETVTSAASVGGGKQRELRMSHIKKPLNAFMLYMKEMRPHVMAEVGLKERQSAEINRILGRRWHMLNKDEQQKYYDMARKERELHMERYPGWSARDNYAIHKKKKRKRDKTNENAELKKCRARFGLDQQSLWCKHCKRKKKCLWFKDADMDGGGGAGDGVIDHSPPLHVVVSTPTSAAAAAATSLLSSANEHRAIDAVGSIGSLKVSIPNGHPPQNAKNLVNSSCLNNASSGRLVPPPPPPPLLPSSSSSFNCSSNGKQKKRNNGDDQRCSDDDDEEDDDDDDEELSLDAEHVDQRATPSSCCSDVVNSHMDDLADDDDESSTSDHHHRHPSPAVSVVVPVERRTVAIKSESEEDMDVMATMDSSRPRSPIRHAESSAV